MSAGRAERRAGRLDDHPTVRAVRAASAGRVPAKEPLDADELRALHVPGSPLVLPNAWDAASAKIVEEAGFAAVATSSGAVARSLGYEDGGRMPADEVFSAVARIARATVRVIDWRARPTARGRGERARARAIDAHTPDGVERRARQEQR